ncbi:hypothetical protein M0R45_024742 [Rubus argutus]|uniref:Uncharacterized protein n=1 Tax=Rubus argutus TaxID=59490 RepID=A0AAW1WU21_RUBAR
MSSGQGIRGLRSFVLSKISSLDALPIATLASTLKPLYRAYTWKIACISIKALPNSSQQLHSLMLLQQLVILDD